MAATKEDVRSLTLSGEALDIGQRAQLLGLAEQLAGVGHWLVDLAQEMLYWSDEIYRIHGVTPDTYTPDLESAISFYHPDDVDQVRDAVESAIIDKCSFQFECRIVRPSGEIRTVQSKSIVQTDEDGNAISVFGIFHDVTELRSTEDRLREINDRYQQAIKGAKYGLWDWDIGADSMHWASQAVLDPAADESIQDPLGELRKNLHPRDRDRVITEIKAYLKGLLPGPYDTQYRLQQPDGSYAWLHVVGQATWDGSGAPIRMAGSSVDITDRKNDERTRDTLYRLLSNADMSPRQHVREMLKIARQHLRMDLAIVSRIEESCLTIEFADAEADKAQPQGSYPLADTLCSRVLSDDRFYTTRGDELKDVFAPGADSRDPTLHYVGIPLYVDGKQYGTLSFRAYGYTANLLEYRRKVFVTMLAQWIAYEIAQHQSKEKLLQSARKLAERDRELDVLAAARERQ